MGDGESNKPSASAPAAPAGSIKTRVFWAQRPGAQGSAMLTTRGDTAVGFLVEEVAKKLKLDAPLDSIALQLASADGTLFTAKDAAGNPQPVTLSSMDTIDEALKKAAEAAGRTIKDTDKLRIIVSAAPLAASADGEDADAVQRRSVRSCAVPLCRCTA